MKPSWYKELSSINVDGHTKTKGGLKYLSWMWAWTELLSRYPLSYSTVHETEDGMLVWRDPIGCHVKTSITIVWEDENDGLCTYTATEYLPVMDMRNKAVPYENVDSMLVNKTIQRSLTKCIARLGLGAHVYVGQDLTADEQEQIELKGEIKALIEKKISLSENAKTKVADYCKDAERKAFPDYDEESITGNYRNIDDVEILKELKRKLMSIRK